MSDDKEVTTEMTPETASKQSSLWFQVDNLTRSKPMDRESIRDKVKAASRPTAPSTPALENPQGKRTRLEERKRNQSVKTNF